jgi:hypothetical protein
MRARKICAEMLRISFAMRNSCVMLTTLGIAIAARVMITRTAITNSIKEKPRDASASGDLEPAIDLVLSNRIVPRIFKVWRLRSIFNRVVVLIALERPTSKSLINLFSVVYGKKTKRLKGS